MEGQEIKIKRAKICVCDRSDEHNFLFYLERKPTPRDIANLKGTEPKDP